MPKYVGRNETGLFGDQRYVVRERVSGEDIAGAGVDIAFNVAGALIRGGKNARIGRAAAELERAETLALDGKYAEAINVATSIVRKFPKEPVPYMSRASIYIHQVDNMTVGETASLCDLAIADLNKAEQLGETDFSLYKYRSMLQMEKGATQAGLQDANTAVKRYPNEGEAHLFKAWVLQHIGDYELALASVQRALQLETTLDGYFRRSQIYAEKGDYEKALADCSRAIALDSSDVELYEYRASILRKLGQADEADKDEMRASQTRSAVRADQAAAKVKKASQQARERRTVVTRAVIALAALLILLLWGALSGTLPVSESINNQSLVVPIVLVAVILVTLAIKNARSSRS